jgi:competence protein ComGF
LVLLQHKFYQREKRTTNNWWLFYDQAVNVQHKCQLKNNQKNGYCLLHEMKKLIKASKYSDGRKIKEWTNFLSFKNENSLNDLK